MDEVKELVLFMQDKGVSKFTVADVSVEFDPHSAPINNAPEETVEERISRLKKEAEAALKEHAEVENWSV
jgi:hypothetical protein